MALENTEQLINLFGKTRAGSVQGLNNFAHIPDEKLKMLAETALDEDWGQEFFVLRKYLAVHVFLSICQGKYVWNNDQLVVSAGFLQNRFGIPIYLAFESNLLDGRQQFYLRWVGDNPRFDQLPERPQLPEWPKIDLSSEVVVVAKEHIFEGNMDRFPYLKDTPPVAQMCAVTGAIQWSLHRELVIKQLYMGVPSYFVPLYLQTRENITKAPDLVAPIQVQLKNLLVRTVLEPYMAYDKARVAVNRHDELPPWLLLTWHEHSANVTPSALEHREMG